MLEVSGFNIFQIIFDSFLSSVILVPISNKVAKHIGFNWIHALWKLFITNVSCFNRQFYFTYNGYC